MKSCGEELFGPPFYSWNAGKLHIVMLPVPYGDAKTGYKTVEVARWLKNDLEMKDPEQVFIVITFAIFISIIPFCGLPAVVDLVRCFPQPCAFSIAEALSNSWYLPILLSSSRRFHTGARSGTPCSSPHTRRQWSYQKKSCRSKPSAQKNTLCCWQPSRNRSSL